MKQGSRTMNKAMPRRDMYGMSTFHSNFLLFVHVRWVEINEYMSINDTNLLARLYPSPPARPTETESGVNGSKR